MNTINNNTYSYQINSNSKQQLPSQHNQDLSFIQQNNNTSGVNSIEVIKKNILYDAQSFNIHQMYNHKHNKLLQRQKQLQTYSQLNKRLQTQILSQKQKQYRRKQIVKQQLKQQYDRQMKQHQKQKKKQKDYQKIYAKQLVQYQDHYYNRRMNDIARMYNPSAYKVGDSLSNSGSRLKTQQLSRGQIYQKFASHQHIDNKQSPYKSIDIKDDVDKSSILNNINYKPSFNPFNPVGEQRKFSTKPQSYQQYLKKQIQRKQMKKDQQKHDKLQRQFQQSKRNQLVYRDSLDQLKNIQRRQQQQFKKGLDQQVSVKKGVRKYF